MLLIGSKAMKTHFPEMDHVSKDVDFISTYAEFQEFVKKTKPVSVNYLSGDHAVVRMQNGTIVEFTFAWGDGATNSDLVDRYVTGVVPAEVLLMLKLSHRYLRNSPHFHKTMKHIRFMRERGVVLDDELKSMLRKREAETYVYAHPNLNQNKQGFFTDSVPYKYDHDSIHSVVAIGDRPAYKEFSTDGAEVKSSKKRFFKASEEVRINAVTEESYVLALERSIVPFGKDPETAFKMALEKICTSITSGWFREYAWENYDRVVSAYNPDFVNKFNDGVERGLVTPYSG